MTRGRRRLTRPAQDQSTGQMALPCRLWRRNTQCAGCLWRAGRHILLGAGGVVGTDPPFLRSSLLILDFFPLFSWPWFASPLAQSLVDDRLW